MSIAKNPNEPSSASPDGPQQWAEPGIGPAWRYKFFLLAHPRWRQGAGISHRVFRRVLVRDALSSIRRRCSYYLRPAISRFETNGITAFADTYRLVLSYSMTLMDMMIVNILGTGVIPPARRSTTN